MLKTFAPSVKIGWSYQTVQKLEGIEMEKQICLYVHNHQHCKWKAVWHAAEMLTPNCDWSYKK